MESGCGFCLTDIARQGREVSVRGKGLDATIIVGKQTVRFDGKKVVFGK
jgi:uncharacterized Zn-binding protein involved in type VI secretion